MAPVVHGLEQKYNGLINVTYLDIDDPATDVLKKELVYYGTPTIILLDGEGNIVNTWVGLVSGDGMIEAIEALLLGEMAN